MINKKIENYFLNSTSSVLTEYKNISMVFHTNNLSHAILILKQSNYNQIPVLNYDKKFIGLISISKIYKSLGIEYFKEEVLDKELVGDHVDTHYALIKEGAGLEDILKLLINYNFVNVVDKDGVFLGIITRSSVLKKTKALLHTLEKFSKD